MITLNKPKFPLLTILVVTASMGSSTIATTLFEDTFEADLQKWEQSESTTISNGYLQIPKGIDKIRSASEFGLWEDFNLELDFRINSVAAGIVFQRQNDSNYLLWQFNSSSGNFRPHQLINGQWTLLKEIPAALTSGTWYHLRLESTAGVIKTWLDNVLLDESTIAFTAAGSIGFRTGSSESFQVDNIIVEADLPADIPPPETPVSLTGKSGYKNSAGVWIFFENSENTQQHYQEVYLQESADPFREIFLTWPQDRTGGFIPLPEDSLKWNVNVRATNENGTSDWVTLPLFRGETPAPGFDQWMSQYFNNNTPVWLRSWESDLDHDRVPAGIEYVLGRNPTLPEFNPVIELTREADGFAIVSPPSLHSDAVLTYFASTDLQTWESFNAKTMTDDSNNRFIKATAKPSTDRWLIPYCPRVSLLRPEETTMITDPEPMLSWSLQAAGNGNYQSGCEVLIATDKVLLSPESADVWSSGVIDTDQPRIQIPAGKVSSNSVYWWTVRIWNDQMEESSFATPATFSTGTLSGTAYTSRPPQVQTPVYPVNISLNSDGNTFIDFGRAAFAGLRMKAPGAQGGESVTIHLGEKLKSDGHVDRNPGATIRYRAIQASLQPGDQWTNVPIPKYANWPSIANLPSQIGQVMPFRYIEIEGLPQLPTTDEVEQLTVHTPWDEDASYFSSNDETLNAVWDLCKYTIKATSFAAVYIDGDRERRPYEADAYINQMAHYGVEPAYGLARFSHEYLLDNPTWPTEWKHHSILMAWQDYLYTGDKRSLEKFYSKLQQKLFPGFEREDELINPDTRDIVDWPANQQDRYEFSDYNTVVNAFQYGCLREMAKIADTLGMADDAATYTSRADTLYQSFNTSFWDETQRRYVDGEGATHSSQHANFFPLTFGLVPDDRKADVIAYVDSRGMACSVYGAYHLLEGLLTEFQAETAVELMRSRAKKSWFNMIVAGSTVTLEAWDKSIKSNLDWNHAWGAAPAGIIPRYILGIRPTSPGFASLIVQPQPGPLTWIEGKVPTPLGPVELTLDQKDDRLTGTLSVPPGCTFDLDLPIPQGSSGQLYLSGEFRPTASQLNGRIRLTAIPSGSFTFEVR